MVFPQTARLLFPFILSFSLVACGGAGFSDGTSGNTSSNPNAGVVTPELRLGNIDETTFIPGALYLTKTQLEAEGTSQLKAWMVDPDGLPYSGEMTAEVLSECITNGLAEIKKPDVFSSGTITADYIAKGCRGIDNVTLKVSFEGKTYLASASIDVEAPAIGSLRYESNSQNSIGIKGLGLNEVSTIKFRVLDERGKPVVGEKIRFKLNTNIGGIRVLPEIATSDEEGYVTVDVHSGKLSTTVKVTAEVISNPDISTQSRQLVISTGISDQNSISISADKFNPEAFNFDGEEVSINIRASDHFNNPVPDGTAVYFTVEGGQIEPQCFTTNGACSVKWRSSAPRPDNGRVTILATLLGEESFIDSNGNGVLDDGETFFDIGKVYRDDNEDGIFNGSDEPRDSSSNGSSVASDGEYNGTLCNPANTVNICSENKNIFVSTSQVLIMSSSEADIVLPEQISITDGESTAVQVGIQDENGQTMPAGTKVEFSIDGNQVEGGYPHKIISETEKEIGSTTTSGVQNYVVTIGDNSKLINDSFLKVKVTTPKGRVTEKVLLVHELKKGAVELRFGSKEAGLFTTGTLLLSKKQLKAGETTSIKAWMVDPAGLPYPGEMTAEIISECIASDLAKIEQSDKYSTGIITANYTAKGCRGNDDLTMRVSFEGKTFVATSSVDVEAPVIGSVRYESTTKEHIGIKGLGLDEVSTLKFQVLDDNGNPVIGEEVRFTPNTNIGKLRVLPEKAVTDNKGFVTVDVHSGTVSTSVKVTATVVSSPSISTQSRQLVISTGIADQNSISISADKFNPEGFNYDGEEVSVNILVSDHFNNPVPDGTAVFFTTEGGQIEPQCFTNGGGCSVKWKSSQPRPVDGRVTILASLLGEESFVDSNGNGLLDDGESFHDMPKVFRDDNEDGLFNGTDESRDSSGNGIQVELDGQYNGVLCNSENVTNICSENKNIFVNASRILIMSTSNADITAPEQIIVKNNGGASAEVTVKDLHGQTMPVGTKVKFSIDGDEHKLVSSEEYEIQNTTIAGGQRYVVTISDNSEEVKDSYLKIKVTTPKNHVTERVVQIHEGDNVGVAVDGPAGAPNSVEFISALPSSIGIQGFGLNEVSQVKFKIVDNKGRPVPEQRVNFTLSNTLGGASLSVDHAETDESGYVTTIVRAGTTATTVKVNAVVESNPDIKTQSRGLIISTGIADQDSFSLAASVLNPEGLDRDGETVQLTVMAADHFNNPVPDGTAVYFTTEGGVVDPDCLTVKGTCTVEWRSSNPRPVDGRATVLATMLGEESFVDSTGDGLFGGGADRFTDLPEAFLDKDEDGVFDSGEDEPRDFNENGQWDDRDGQYNGVLCVSGSGLCSPEKNTYVRDDLVLIMSGAPATIDINPSVLDATSGSVSTTLTLSDRNNQPIPAGSKIEISMKGGGELLSEGNITMVSTNTTIPPTYGINIQGEKVEAGTATYLTIRVTTPSGIVSVRQYPVTMPIKVDTTLEAENDFAIATVNNALEIPVLANDSYTGNVTIVTAGPVGLADAAAGRVDIVGSRIFFTPTTGFTGEASYKYTIEDEQGGTANATISISVTP